MKSQVLIKLNHWLLDRYQAGQRAVLIVDEAQNLSIEMLEEIRLLTNLETSTEKLLQIVLAGQPELEAKLNQPMLRQLRQRITLRAKTLPLTLEDTRGYLNGRLRMAGNQGDEIFSPEAIEAVHRFAKGIPRVTNIIGEHALISAFVDQRKPVTREIIEAVAREFGLHEIDPMAQAIRPPQPSTNRNHPPQVQALPQPLNTVIDRPNKTDTSIYHQNDKPTTQEP
jgi:type II secretory pathway predicted ATPase ExeA